MDHGNWEIGLNATNFDDLFSGERAAMTLWFLAGYLKGLTDGGELHSGERRVVLEPDGDDSWRLRCKRNDPGDGNESQHSDQG